MVCGGKFGGLVGCLGLVSDWGYETQNRERSGCGGISDAYQKARDVLSQYKYDSLPVLDIQISSYARFSIL